MKWLPKTITEGYAFIISEASVITCFILCFVLFSGVIHKVLQRLPNVLHDNSLITSPDFNHLASLWGKAFHAGFLFSWICFEKFQQKLFKCFQALGKGKIYLFWPHWKVLANVALNSCSFPSFPLSPILLFWNKDVKFVMSVIFVL